MRKLSKWDQTGSVGLLFLHIRTLPTFCVVGMMDSHSESFSPWNSSDSTEWPCLGFTCHVRPCSNRAMPYFSVSCRVIIVLFHALSRYWGAAASGVTARILYHRNRCTGTFSWLPKLDHMPDGQDSQLRDHRSALGFKLTLSHW